MDLHSLSTPALVVDRSIVTANCKAMASRATTSGVALRPHMKTGKAAPIAAIATRGHSGAITVSTPAEAEFFAARGYTDMTYAVSISAHKLERFAVLERAGASVTLVTDSLEAIHAVQAEALRLASSHHVMVEVDTGGKRSGVDAESDLLIELASAIHASPNLHLDGVLTHAGHSYHCADVAGVIEVAEQERSGVVRAAQRIRAASMPCQTVSAGSTPTAIHAASFEGITEIRPGVYTLFDLDQVGIGSCDVADVAATVLCTVIGHNRNQGTAIVDAGGLALSKDVSAAEFMPNVGYGLVADMTGGLPVGGLFVTDVHQEHGVVADAGGASVVDAMPIGTRWRVLPNHVCMTAAAHDRFHVVEGGGSDVVDIWERATGW